MKVLIFDVEKVLTFIIGCRNSGLKLTEKAKGIEKFHFLWAVKLMLVKLVLPSEGTARGHIVERDHVILSWHNSVRYRMKYQIDSSTE